MIKQRRAPRPLVDPLTDEQRDFAEKHYHIAENYTKYTLKDPENSGLVALGFLKAVREYTEREDLRQYAFSTIVKWHVRSILQNAHKSNYVRRNSLNTASLCDSGLRLSDTIADTRTWSADDTIFEMMLTDALRALPSEKQKLYAQRGCPALIA